jgi:hypothetical protein
VSKRTTGAGSTPAPRPRSGKHVSRRLKVSLDDEALHLLRAAAHAEHETMSDWVRSRLAVAVADELGLDPLDTMGVFMP